MLASLEWLKQYVDINISVAELCDKITRVGLEVDTVTQLGKGLEGVITGKNLHRFAALAVIQHANPQVVAIGMTVNFHNLTGDYTLQALAKLGNGVNLQADTGNFIGCLT